MENMQVLLYPKQIHIATQVSMSIRLTYKKMSITTNHELQKYQNRESYQIKNSVATINDEVKFKLSKQFQLSNTKIVIIVIGTKGREVSCLGDISLDLATIKKNKDKDKDRDPYKAKIDKCKDPKAFLLFDIKFIQKPVDLNEMKKSKKEKQKIPQLGLLKTEYYYKEELYISRRQKQDKPTAYEISRRNYKNTEIVRNTSKSVNKQQKDSVSKPPRESKDSAKQNNNQGSYKKRFLYDVQRLDKSRQKSTNKEIGSNYLKVYKKDESPSPRTKTPQPITLETLKSKQTHNRTQSRVSPLDLSGFQSKRSKELNDTNQLIDPDTFRAQDNHKDSINLSKEIYQPLSQSNISSNSLSSITNQKQNKYKIITQKLELIENKIQKSKQKYGENHNEERSQNGRSKTSKSQIDEVESYQIGTANRTKGKSNTNRHYNTQPDSPYQHSSKIPLRSVQSRESQQSPSQSTCPRNERAPSPIQINETPVVSKQPLDEIKMSEFTINSEKHYPSQLEQQKSPQSLSPVQGNDHSTYHINQASFDDTTQPSIANELTTRNPPSSVNQQNDTSRQKSVSPQGRPNERRGRSPPELSFQKRESEIKLEKKSSLGRNYIETQVKMLELEIQDRDMKFEKLQKKLAKKEEQCAMLLKQNEEYQKKLTAYTNQLIDLKTKSIEFERQQETLDTLKKQLVQRDGLLAVKQQEIQKITVKLDELKNKEPIYVQSKQKSQDSSEVKQAYNSLQKEVASKNGLIDSLNSQLETYQHEINSLRQRTNQFKQWKQKYGELLKNHESSLGTISALQRKLKQAQNQKSVSNSSIVSSESPKTGSKQQIASKQAKSTEQIIKQTIEKQTLLQQSLKSLQNQNKSLSEQLQSSNQQKSQLLQQLQQLSSTQQDKSQSQAEVKNLQQKNTFLSQKISKLQTDTKSLQEKLEKKEKTLLKLSEVNQSLNTKLFNLQEQQKNQFHELNEQTDTLVMKNAQNQQLINQLNQKISSKEKQMKILKTLLRQREDQQNKTNEQKKQQMKRQVSRESEAQGKNGPSRFSEHESGSKSAQLTKIKVTQQGKEDYYENYLNEKAKCTNLEAQLRYAQNEIRNQKMRIDLLTQEKKNLEQEIDMIAYNDEKELAKKGLEHKVSMQSQSIADTMKLQNRALKEQIKLLQFQVRDLNALLDSAIQKTSNIESAQMIAFLNSVPQAEKGIINEKYLALVKRLEAYENELRTKKNKMAEIVNAIWRGGNATLIDEIDRIMGVEE